MSRSNPYKKKRRAAKKTALFYCEGADDKAFLEYLKMTFAKDSGVAINIKQNYGHGANGVLSGIFKQIPADIMVCMYDIDEGIDVELKQRVERHGILCIEHKPCLEAFLLEILEEKDYSCHQKCDNCKKRFEKKYLDERKRKNKNSYARLFPKEFLLKRAKKMKNLKMLIDIMNGKNANKNQTTK